MRRREILIGTLAIAAVVAAISGALYARAQAAGAPYAGLYTPVSVVCPGPTDSVASQGAPGVRPHNDCTPSFTQQDVRDFLAHGAHLGHAVVTGRTSVTRVVFLTIGDLAHASGDNSWTDNYPADLVVCYAQMSGEFTVYGPSPDAPKKTWSDAFIVFDGHTGNQLVVGTGARLG